MHAVAKSRWRVEDFDEKTGVNTSAWREQQLHATSGGALHGTYRYDVQGLRAVAVLAVILFHVNKQWLPAGFLGVDMFFVISGYIITPIIMRRAGKGFWLDFYWGRVRRIVPAFLVMLAMVASVASVASVLFITPDFKVFYKSQVYALLFWANGFFANFGSYFAPAAHELPLLHTWSLAIEMQFYLLLPALLLFLPRRWLMPSMLALCVGLTAYAEFRLGKPGAEQGVYFSLFARIPEFLLGACLALSSLGQRWGRVFASVVGAVATVVLLCCFLFMESGHFPGLIALLPCSATALLIAASRGVLADGLSKPPMVWIGGISYSLYLWHWPVLAFIRYWNGHYTLSTLQLLMFVVLTLGFSCLSYYLVEVPLRSPGRGRSIVTVCLVTVLTTLGGAFAINRMIEQTPSQEFTRYASPDEICHGQIVGQCKQGDLSQYAHTLVLGDSHAAQLNYFFDVAGKQNGFAVKVVTASNCVPIPGFDIDRIPAYSRASCQEQIQAVGPLLEQADTIVLAAMWQWQMSSAAFADAFRGFLTAMSAQGKRIVVMAQVPMFEVNVQRMQRFALLGAKRAPEPERTWVEANRKVGELVAGVEGATFVDFSASPFFKDAPYQQGVLIYLDNHHLNEVGAIRYGEMAGPALARLIGQSR
ncbi:MULTISPECIES: acyltransferase family protein [Pseudomonas]|uniref:acyltransferase family protein n=1 Tax=Pseudomonas mosselii TaxID=78327 RepID=UPI00148659B7|nr:acyltransferase family protein [Pseudomonas mosselii]